MWFSFISLIIAACYIYYYNLGLIIASSTLSNEDDFGDGTVWRVVVVSTLARNDDPLGDELIGALGDPLFNRGDVAAYDPIPLGDIPVFMLPLGEVAVYKLPLGEIAAYELFLGGV